MPSAHYQPLVPRADHDQDHEHGHNNDDDERWTIETDVQSQSNGRIRYHPQLAEELPSMGGGMAASRYGRAGNSGYRRFVYIMLILLPACFLIYFVIGPQSQDSEDADGDIDPHNGIGKRRHIKLSLTTTRLTTAHYHPFHATIIASKSTHGSIRSMMGHALNESLHICSESHEDRRLYIGDKPRSAYAQLPVIYFVTPTYPRREQIPELTRLAYTLLHVPRLHWLVANDREGCDTFLDTQINGFGIPYTHMASPMPSEYRKAKPAPRGVANRRAALQWLHQHNLTNGVLYFGDDDNTYDLRLFSEIRHTQRVSMFPVGLIAEYAISGPVVREGKVVAFLDSWVAGRRWPVDMAGFAVSLSYMAQYPNVNMPYKPGYEEDLFLRSIGLHIDQIEPRGNNCTEILVWHTQTKNKKSAVVRLESRYMDERSNLGALFRLLERMGVARASEHEGPVATISKNGKSKSHAYFLS
ncbi:hypothetical protein AWZ03_006808 [Drosophila navojoa]|uniref:Galactosylgalactosylxylosylprotein 3-beta-glucuronosyltransferase n=2 Tax=Drosophila navojoa TaxID=7232 RepID=A0A484BG84_DRONA|nr:hypothetical protein AWZ03_006808 [Drosophila navojoa]